MIYKNSCDNTPELSLDSSSLLTPLQRQALLTNLADDLPRLARQRIQIMLMADQQMSAPQICQKLGCSQLTAEYWAKVAATGDIDQWQIKSLGRPKKIDQLYITRLQELIAHHPQQYGYPFQRWTIDWLSKHLERELGILVSNRNLKRLLKKLGLSTCKTSPSSDQAITPLKNKVVIQDLSLSPNHNGLAASTSAINLTHDYQFCLDKNYRRSDHLNHRDTAFHGRMEELRNSR